MLAISPIRNYSTPSFGIFLHTIKDKDGNAVNRCDTAIFRNDLDFDKVVNFIDNKYEGVEKPKMLNYACSDGEETYSLLAIMNSMLGKKAQKFYPITAKDINSDALKLANEGVYFFTFDEYMASDHFLGDDFNKYFSIRPRRYLRNPKNRAEQKKYDGANYAVSEELKPRVKFEYGNILDDAKNIDFKNTVLFARNFWPYLSKEEIVKLVKILAKRMDNSSTLIIGSYDKEYGIDKLLIKNGFVETKVENVFELPKNFKYKNYIYDYEKHSIYE